ncbi:GP174 protein, partial [Xiphorhynchus elegans]|nr:GP174 protein [Xiphorhynchus elegans]
MESNVSSGNCTNPQMSFQSTLYATTYTLIFIPGLLANSAALWVLCRFISRKSKAIIFMINLAVADLAHVLSLPLRTYYYINHTWPFGSFLCQVCFYLKYLNIAAEKQKALRMVLMCAAVFCVCFTPYHINFPFFMMVIENIIRDCAVHRATLRFHPVSLCLASLNCCLDPVLYYFMTSEFQDQLLRHGCVALRARLPHRRGG